MVMPATVSTACPTKKKTWKRHGIIGKKDCSNEKPVIETLIDGEITVEEIIISF